MYIFLPTPHTLGESLESFESPFTGSLGVTGASPTLEAMACRLLCASNLTYRTPTQATAPVPYSTSPAKDYYKIGGFIDRPEVIVGKRTKGIDLCLIGTLQGPAPTQKSIVLAFRGTLSPVGGASIAYFTAMTRDWLNDFEAVLVPFTKIPEVQVHKGFNDSVNSFFGQGIVKTIKARLRLYKGAQLYITGHSKGGALAHLAALLLRTKHPEIPLAGVISFEAPRAGHPTFVEACNASGIDSLRYEYKNDIVPHVPQSGIIAKLLGVNPAIAAALSIFYPNSSRSLQFEHVGKLRFINWSNSVVEDSRSLQLARFTKLSGLLASSGGGAIIPLLATQHSMECGTKAWGVICNTKCT